MSERRERSYKMFEPTRKIFKERERKMGSVMCSRDKGIGNGGGDWCCVKTNRDSEKINRREIVLPKNVRTDQKDFRREREEMSMRDGERDGGEENLGVGQEWRRNIFAFRC